MKNFETVIGLEIHAQLLTKSKIFCSCSTQFGSKPNSNTCPVCLGLPGALPVLNVQAIEYVIKMGLATHCSIAEHSVFARKNYFYPDLPKGYQISQYDQPICEHGWIELDNNGEKKPIRIRRIHLEEDAGKSVHEESYVDEFSTLVDLNRCGTPLIEIVTEPDLHSPKQAVQFLNHIRQLVQYLRICDGNMEEGSLRCDANISIRQKDRELFGTRTELKNMNSFRNVERALEYEIQRQISIIIDGGEVVQATLMWDADLNEARELRSKEESHDYRYFPEPDLVPIQTNTEDINNIQNELPELPYNRKNRFMSEYGLPEYDSVLLTTDIDLADFFETVVSYFNDPKMVSNWFMGEVLRILHEKKIKINDFPISPTRLAQLLKLLKDNTISTNAAKTVFKEMLESDDACEDIVNRLGLRQISSDQEIKQFIQQVFEKYPNEQQEFKNGKHKLIGFFIGEVMKVSRGKANPHEVKKILEAQLNN